MTFEDKKRQLTESLAPIEDPYERFAFVIDFGKEKPRLQEDEKIEAFKVQGCMSNLWLVPEFKEERVRFRCESDSQIVQGMAWVLCDLFSDLPANDVSKADAEFLSELGLTQHLSSNRRNGLSRVMEKIRGYGEAFSRAEADTGNN